MKPVTFKHSWGANQTEEQEMEQKFGVLLTDFETSEPYETERSLLFKKGTKYIWLGANGCSCWEGDYDGWELSKPDLKKLALKTWETRYDWRDTADALVAKWVMENL